MRPIGINEIKAICREFQVTAIRCRIIRNNAANRRKQRKDTKFNAMGTEVKLKPEAIERRIAELEGKMPDIQASKEGAEARAPIRRLKAKLKTYPQEPKKRIYKIKARFIFDGVFEIRAHTRKEAVQMAKIGCGMNIGEIHTCYGTDVDWEFDCKPDKIVK